MPFCHPAFCNHLRSFKYPHWEISVDEFQSKTYNHSRMLCVGKSDGRGSSGWDQRMLTAAQVRSWEPSVPVGSDPVPSDSHVAAPGGRVRNSISGKVSRKKCIKTKLSVLLWQRTRCTQLMQLPPADQFTMTSAVSPMGPSKGKAQCHLL